MRIAAWGLGLVVLAGCAAKPKPTVSSRTTSPPPAAIVAVGPSAPVWKNSAPTTDWPVRAMVWEELPREDPVRLVRDLADAKACVAVRAELARFVVSRLDRVPPLLPQKSLTRLRIGLENSAVPGCAIARRDCGDDGKDRQWCWSEGVLDSATVRSLAHRELARIDSVRANTLAAEVFRVDR